MSALHSTNAGERVGASMATGSLSPAMNKQQMSGHSRVGQTRRGCCAQTLAASDDVQDWSAIGRAGIVQGGFSSAPVLTFTKVLGAGFGRRPFHSSFAPGMTNPSSDKRALWGGFLPRTRGARTHSLRGLVCRPTVRQSLPYQHLIQCFADRLHFQTILSNGCTAHVNSCASRGLGNVRKSFGEIRNV